MCRDPVIGQAAERAAAAATNPSRLALEVQGIPTFVIIDKDGAVVTTDARGEVSGDPTGENFPWKPKTVSEILSAVTVEDKDGKTFPLSSLKGEAVVGLYFSAHWCPPCKGFTPELAKKYAAIKEAGKKFEIVFVSSDRDEGAFKEYFAEMPWLALPYADRDAKNDLSKSFA